MLHPPRLRFVPRRRWPAIAVVAFVCAAARMSPAAASPGLVGTRHLGMGEASRASSRGTGAMLINPANLGSTRQFEIAPVYQVRVEDNTHGVGLLAMDSLNNQRFALGLGYLATLGGPKVTYVDAMDQPQTLRMVHVGHEVSLPISVNAVLGWLAIGVRPKFQFTALRFADADGTKQDARAEQTAFGLDVAASFSARRWLTVSVIGYNLAGPSPLTKDLNLAPIVYKPDTLDRSRVSPVADYARSLSHGLAVFPTGDPGFSLNFDGTYDFTSYWWDNHHTRMVFAGGAEYTVRNMVPLRLGGYWDGRGRGKDDDRGYIAAGLGYFRSPPKGAVGFDLGIGFSRQITGPSPDTRFGITLALLLNPGT